MANKNFLLGMLGVTLVFGILATGCPTGSESEPATYTVTFDTDGGSPAPAQQSVTSGGKVTSPASEPYKAGYTFDGWYKDAAETTLWNFDTDTVTANTTIYAKWVSGTAQSYTVSFDADGGYPTPNSQSVTSGGKVTSPASEPYKAGYTFDGWYKDAAKTTLWNFDTDVVTAATTIYAKWVSGTAQSYTVSFDADGGYPTPNSQSVTSGGKVTSPASEPYKAGYTFDGWYKDAAKTTLWNFDTDTVTTYTTIYAKWIAETVQSYTVSFDADGGYPTPNSQSVTSGGKVTSPASEPYKSGYTFAGWYKDAAKTTLWNFDTDTVMTYTTIYAKWQSSSSSVVHISLGPDDPPLSGISISENEQYQFSVGSGYSSYEWYWDGEEIDGADSPYYTLAANSKSPGIYELLVVVSTGAGEILSTRCQVTIKAN